MSNKLTITYPHIIKKVEISKRFLYYSTLSVFAITTIILAKYNFI